MARIRIKQMEERVATRGLHMGDLGTPEVPNVRRKLEPGEVVEIPDKMTVPNDSRTKLIDLLFNTGKIDLLPDSTPITRPLDYASYREATLCSPSFRPNGESEEREMLRVRAEVEARLDNQSSPVEVETETEPADDTPSRTSRRRQNQQAADHGENRIT